MDVRIDISPDGKLITGLYTDKLQYTDMGVCSTHRATDVRFDEEAQNWKVHILDENERILDAGHSKRADAINAEIDYLNVRGPS